MKHLYIIYITLMVLEPLVLYFKLEKISKERLFYLLVVGELSLGLGMYLIPCGFWISLVCALIGVCLVLLWTYMIVHFGDGEQIHALGALLIIILFVCFLELADCFGLFNNKNNNPYEDSAESWYYER